MYIITGMHRSGTSLLGQLLYKAGINMGSDDELYPADKWNSEGYYEHLDIKTLNEKLLHGIWGRLVYFRLPSEKTIMKRAQKHSEDICAISGRHANKVVKDPRFPLTLGAWRAEGAEISKVIICLREPLQVAQSLKKRNKIFISHGLKLWYEHNKRLQLYLEGVPVFYTYYPSILNEETYMREMSAIFRFLDFSIPDEKLTELRASTVKPGMQHNKGSVYEYPEHISALWEVLKEKHRLQFKDTV